MSNEEILAYSKLLEVTEEEAKFFLEEWRTNERQLGDRLIPLLEKFKASFQKLEDIEKLVNGEDDEQNQGDDEKRQYYLTDEDGFVRFVLDGDNNFSENLSLIHLEEIIQRGITLFEDFRNDLSMEVSFLKQSSDVPKKYDHVMSQSEIILKGIKKIFMQQRMFRRRYEVYIENFRESVRACSFVRGCDRAEQEFNIKRHSKILSDLFMLGIDDFSSLDQWRAFAVENKTSDNSLFSVFLRLLKLFKFIYKYAELPLSYEFRDLLLRLTVSTDISVEMQEKLRKRIFEVRNLIGVFPAYIREMEECRRYYLEFTDCLSETMRAGFRYSAIIDFWRVYQLGKKQGQISIDLKFPTVLKKVQTNPKLYGVAFDMAIRSSFEKEVLLWGVYWHGSHKEYPAPRKNGGGVLPAEERSGKRNVSL